MVDDHLLYGSEALTREADELVVALRAWCAARRAEGARPVPVAAARRVAFDDLAGEPGREDLRRRESG